MKQDGRLQNSADEQWKRFAATGSVLDYLDYKSQLKGCTAKTGKDCYADSDRGTCLTAGQGGGSRPDFDDPYT